MAYNPFRIDFQHMNDKVCCRLRTVDGPVIPAFGKIGVMIRMGMPVFLSARTRVKLIEMTYVKRYAVTPGIAPYLKASTATGIPVRTL